MFYPNSSSNTTTNQSTNKLINNPYFNASSLNGNSLTGVNGVGGAGLVAPSHQHHHHHHHRHQNAAGQQQQLTLPNVGAGSNAFGNASVIGNNATLNANDFLKSLHQHFETNEQGHGNLASSSLNNFNSFNPAAGSLNVNNLLGNGGSFRNNSFNTHKAHHHSHTSGSGSGSGSQNYLNYHQNHHQSQKNLLNYSKTNDNLNINNTLNTHTHPRYRTSSLNSNYRNYFSATESCGEDCDDSSAGYSHQPRRRFNNNFDNKFLTSKLDQINTNFVNNLNRQQHQIPSSHRHANHFPRAINNSNNLNALNSSLNQSGLDDSFEKKNVSYASINLKQPLKDFNYFSDSEGAAASNRIKYRNNSTPSATFKQQQKLQLQQQQFGQVQGQGQGIEPLTQEQIAALDSVFGADTPQPSETPQPNNFNYNTNFGGNTMNMNNNSFQFSLPQYQQQQNVAKSAHGFSKLNSFNTKPQGFVPYGQETSNNSAAFQSFDQSPKYGGGSWSQQNQGPYSPGMLNKSSNNSFGFQPQMQREQLQQQPQGGKGLMNDESYYIQQLQNQYQQQQQQRQQVKSEYVDPMEAKYEREMGSELHKPLSSTYQDLLSYLSNYN